MSMLCRFSFLLAPRLLLNTVHVHKLYFTYLLTIIFCVQMHAVDRDSGVNGQLSYSLIYQLETNRVFGVRPDPSNPSIAVLYTLQSFDRESSSGYGAFTYKGIVTLKVI